MLSTFNLKRLVYAKSTHVRKFWLSGVGGSYSTSSAAYLSGVTMHPPVTGHSKESTGKELLNTDLI